MSWPVWLAAASISTVISIVGGVLGIAVVLGAAIVVLLRSTKNEVISDQVQLIAALRTQAELHKQELDAAKSRIAALESDLVDRVASRVAEAVTRALEDRRRPRRD